MKQGLYFKRFFASLMLLAVSALSWGQLGYSFEVDGIYYSVNSDGISVRVSCPLKTVPAPYYTEPIPSYSGDVVIPSLIKYKQEQYAVTSIASDAFYNCSDLTSITIPNSVTNINKNAFYRCSSLRSVIIPNSVTSISFDAFNGCPLTSVTINSNAILSKSYPDFNIDNIFGSQVKEYIIGDEVTSIGDKAFKGCSRLTSITIPESVTSIGSSAFYGCSGLTSITIPESVTSIGKSAFYGCSGLTSVTIPESVTSIDENAFDGCSGLTSVTIGNGVTSIGESAFSGCSRLTSVTIGSGVTSIGNYAFSGCSGLTSINIPNSVTSIGESAFSGCSGLTSINIPNSVTSIGESAFSGCSGLTSINIPNSITSFGEDAFSGCISLPVEDNLRYADTYLIEAVDKTQSTYAIKKGTRFFGANAFRECRNLLSITIPNSVVGIGKYAFYGCSELALAFIGNGVTSIGQYAFNGCSGLTSITIPESVTSIGISAFSGCSGLTSITIPESVTSIGNYAFSGCSSLTSITIPESVMSIGSSVFKGCSRLTSVTINSNAILSKSYPSDNTIQNIFGSQVKEYIIGDEVTSIGSSAFSGCSGLTSITIPESVTSIGNYAFSGCSGLTSITIPESVTSIGYYAFSGCSSLTSITIPESVTSIGTSAFDGCSGLTSVTIGNGVTSIGAWVFDGCSSLTSVTIGSGVTSISFNAFKGCSSLTSVTINSNAILSKSYSSYDNIHNIFGSQVKEYIIGDEVTSIGGCAFDGCSDLAYVTIGNSVTGIGYRAFEGCERLTSVNIPNNVTSIADSVFFGCSGLKSVNIGTGVKSIGSSAFFGCSDLTSVTIPESVTSIGYRAFSDCNMLTSFAIPNSSVTSIADSVFAGCSSLKSITIPESVTSIGYRAFEGCERLTSVNIPNNVTSIADSVFFGCSGLKSVNIGTGVTSIGESAFEGCSGLTSVIINSNAILSKSYPSDNNIQNIFGSQVKEYIIGDEVTSIGKSAFEGCSGLTSVTIPNSVASIGNGVFGGCSSLTSITIPESVTSIGESAFEGCSGLTSITIPDDVTSIGSSVFSGCSSLTSITIPASVTSIGSSAFMGCSSLTSVTIPESVTSIGSSAFNGCSSLSSVTIPNSVTSFSQKIFFGCSCLTSITIPDDVMSIGSYAFSGSGLTSIVIPEGVAIIGQYAFRDCSALRFVTISKSVVSIGQQAFFGCSGLTSVTSLAETVPSTGANMFINVPQASATLYVPAGSVDAYKAAEQWKEFGLIKSKDIPDATSVVLNKSEIAFMVGDQEQLTATVFPENANQTVIWTSSNPAVATVSASGLVTAVAGGVVTITATTVDGAKLSVECVAAVTAPVYFGTCGPNVEFIFFSNNTLDISGSGRMNDFYDGAPWKNYGANIEKVLIEDGVTSIGAGAFKDCSGLTSITIPNSVTSIGAGAFKDCSGLTSITIPNSVTSIGESAFSGCSGLTSITIPDGVTSIGESAFEACSALTSITIPNSVTNIGNNTFYNCSGLTSVTIGSGVTSIANRAFEKCSSLTSVTINSNAILSKSYSSDNNIQNIFGSQVKEYIIGDEVTDIGSFAFSGCYNLNSVTIGNSVTSIGTSAFNNCSSLTSINIPNSITSIGEDSFSGCISLPVEDNLRYADTYLIEAVDKTSNAYVVKEGTRFVNSNAFAGCPNLFSITIPNSVTSIGESAFEGCSGLTSITIPDGVTSIGDKTFYNCSGLTSVNIGTGVTSIGESAFEACSALTSITIPNSVTNIGNNTFYNCSGLTSITIPNSVTSIGKQAFLGCSSLTSVTIPESVTSIGDKTFYNCSGLTSITIPESVTSIGTSAFEGCSGLTSVTIGNSVTSIGGQAFMDCSGLTSITIPENVTSIGESAFNGCSGLTSIDIPNSVTSIGQKAFTKCFKLRSVTCLAKTVPSIYDDAFYAVDLQQVTLYVPALALYAYQTEYPWSWWDFKAIVPINVDDHVYIEKDITSQFPTDWQGWNGATGYTPTQFAPMVTTNDGRTVQVCEKFNGSVAEEGTVFYRTLTGLTNGTYRIELYGAAASTKGRDTKIDSDMTEDDEGVDYVVRLYAETASSEVWDFIPIHWATSFSEVATVVLNNVVVTDGTVEIGMSSNKKFTNWEVIQIKGVTATVDAEEWHAKTLLSAQVALDDDIYASVTGEERTALQQVVADNTTVIERTSEAYQTAITALENATKNFTEAKSSYDGFAAAKTLVEGRNYPYATKAKKDAAEAATAAAAVATSATDAVNKTEALLTAYRQYAESSALMEGIEGAVDVTATYIRNPKAEEAIDANVWQMILGQGSDGYINIYTDQPWTDASGSTNHRYFDGGQYYKSAWDVTLKQDVTLPAGRYQLTAVGRSSQDVALTLIGGEETAEMAHIGAVGGLFNNGWEQTSVEFELTQEATIGIGVKGVTNVIHNWMSFSDFRLVQFPETQVLDTSIALNKTEATIEIGTQEQLTATVLPETAVQAVAWATSDPAVATVDENGLVTAVAVGAVIITATTTDGTNLKATCDVTVVEPAPSYILSGDCGTNVDFVLSNDYTLTISGIGDMFDYIANTLPWKNYTAEIKNVVVEDGVTNIGERAFYGCDGLTSVTIPNSVTSIGDYAFYWCKGLTSVTIPNSVMSIGEDAFGGCSGLTSITVVSGNTKYDSRNDCNAIIETSSNTLVSGCKNTIIPNTVTSIGQSAFHNCSDLTSITIPNSVTSIGSSAFSGCSGLTSITIPESVTSIGDMTFRGCSGLTKSEFSSIENLCKLSFGSGASNPLCYAKHLYIGGQEVKDVIIPNTVTNIGRSAFYGCSGLTSVTIPESVTSIGVAAFNGCSGLTSVTCLAEEVPGMGDAVFTGVPQSTATLYVPVGSVNAYKAAEQWKEFGSIKAYGISEATSVALNKTEITLEFAAQERLTATVLPEDAMQTVTWRSSDPTVATVDGNGLVTAIAAGTATITATTTDGTNLKASCAVTVNSLSGVDYYIMNVETDLFLGGQNLWGTQATLSEDAGIFRFVPGTSGEGYNIVNTLVSMSDKNLGTNLYTDNNGLATVKLDVEAGTTKSVDGIWTIEPQGGGIFAFKCVSEWKWENDAWVETPHGYLCKSETAGYRKGYELMFSETLTDACLFRIMTRDEALAYMINKAKDSYVSFNFLLKNPDFCGRQSTADWTVSADCTDRTLSGGNRNNMCAESWKSTFTISQVVKDLPAGRYQLSAQGFYQRYNSNTDPEPYVFAGKTKASLPDRDAIDASVDNMTKASNAFTADKFMIDPVCFNLAEKTDLEIGFHCSSNKYWAIWDNVQLSYSYVALTSIALNQSEFTMGINETSQLTATVLPEDATNKAVTWTSSDPGVAIVDEYGLVTAIATGVATITATTTDGTDLTASCKVTVEDPAIPGDVNGDGNVNGADIVAVINYVLADDIAGDVNGDGNVNGADIVAVINYVLNDSGNNARQALAQSRAAAAEEPAEILSGTKTEEGISLSLTGGEDCTAFQFMLSLPEGASLTAVTGSEERLGDHELLFRRQQDGRYLVLGYAMDNHCIGESSGELLSLQLEGNANGRATVSEALIFTPQAETRYMNALEIDLPTAVSGIRAKGAAKEGDIYDLGGRKLNKKPSSGYYIQGGKTYFVK